MLFLLNLAGTSEVVGQVHGIAPPIEMTEKAPLPMTAEPTAGAVGSVQAVAVEQFVPEFRRGADEPAVRANHPPVEQIPPIPMPECTHLQEWSEPELVAHADAGPDSPIRAWTFLVWSSDPGAEAPYRFYVNAADGVLVTAQPEVEYADVTGHVSARATPGKMPETKHNPLVRPITAGAA